MIYGSEFVQVHDLWIGGFPLSGRTLHVWMQGCDRACPGCCNESARDPAGPSVAVSPTALARVCAGRDANLLLSGGEPFQQAAALAHVSRLVRLLRPETVITAYTGYRVDELLDGDNDQLGLLRQLDVLIDGPFVAALRARSNMIGSSNQRLFCLSDRVAGLEEALQCDSAARGEWNADGHLRIVGAGIAGPAAERLEESLFHYGLVAEPRSAEQRRNAILKTLAESGADDLGVDHE